MRSLHNRKIWGIIIFVLCCGILLQFSRSQFLFNSVKNKHLFENNFSVLTPPSEVALSQQESKYCIVYDETSLDLFENITKTLDYAEKSYTTYAGSSFKIAETDCKNILLASPFLEDLGDISDVESAVSSGRNVFALKTLEPSFHYGILAPNLGVSYTGDFTITKAMVLKSNLLIQGKDKVFFENAETGFSLDIILRDSAEVLMEDIEGKPIIWKNSYGEGNFITVNTGITKDKGSRGLLIGLFSLVEDTFIYPIFNSKTFYIDDFPAPISRAKNAFIFNEYKMYLPDFYQTIWWTDMLKLAKKYNLVYTGALIESYDDQITPPFSRSDEAEINYFIQFGRELIKSGGEIGLHGYNHQSLTFDENISKEFGYNAWESIDAIKEAFQELNNYVSTAFPSYRLSSYVPPSNVLSKEARDLLKTILPDLVVIASLYHNDDRNLAYVQEYEIAPDNIIEMPRISSGYYLDPNSSWDMYNAISQFGVFSHFIHPDDIISSDRNNGNWENMYKTFELIMKDIDVNFPWLNAYTATESAFVIANELHQKTNFSISEQQISGEKLYNSNTSYYILRTKNKPEYNKEIIIQEIDEDVYLIEVPTKSFKINLTRD